MAGALSTGAAALKPVVRAAGAAGLGSVCGCVVHLNCCGYTTTTYWKLFELLLELFLKLQCLLSLFQHVQRHSWLCWHGFSCAIGRRLVTIGGWLCLGLFGRHIGLCIPTIVPPTPFLALHVRHCYKRLLLHRLLCTTHCNEMTYCLNMEQQQVVPCA